MLSLDSLSVIGATSFADQLAGIVAGLAGMATVGVWPGPPVAGEESAFVDDHPNIRRRTSKLPSVVLSVVAIVFACDAILILLSIHLFGMQATLFGVGRLFLSVFFPPLLPVFRSLFG